MTSLGQSWNALLRAFGLVWLPIALSWLAVGALVAVALSLVGLLGGIDTSGGAIDWVAVAAVAAVVSSLATVALGAGLVISASQIEHERRTAADEQRILRQPYVRVDLGFDDYFNQPGFMRPVAAHMYELADFVQLDVGPMPLAALGSADGHPLSLWLQNLQRQDLGIAVEIRVGIYAAWLSGSGPFEEDFELRFRYLAPGQVTGVRLAHVPRRVHSLVARVTDVTYQDLLGNNLKGAHGAMSVVYAEGKEPLNERYADFKKTLDPARERDAGDPEGTHS